MAVVKAAVKLTVACSVGLCSSLYAGKTLKLSTGHAIPFMRGMPQALLKICSSVDSS